ncbi:MAG: ABC transporter ATP-binding protein [Planctomycetota bacterium]|nr:ABC transporter ATP-binding protein [Planctomycetota bacterium]
MSGQAPLLIVDELRANYGAVEALHNVSLEVREGEIVSVVGANGAGKSTALRCISRLMDSRSKRIEFKGRDLRSLSPSDVVAAGLAHVPEGRQVFSRLTVRENLELGAYLRRDSSGIANDLRSVETLFPILAERRTQHAGTLSGGEQQMLAIGRAMMSRPSLLMMDEPSMGIAPILVARIFAAVRELASRGLTVLLVEQNARAALKMSRRGYVLETGRTTITGTGEELLADVRVRNAYLGEGV